jgi:hypothetical protein
MLTNFSFDSFEKYNDEDLQIFANVINAFLFADKLKNKGIMKGGPTIDQKAMKDALVYCDDRGIEPEKNTKKLIKYIKAINESL